MKNVFFNSFLCSQNSMQLTRRYFSVVLLEYVLATPTSLFLATPILQEGQMLTDVIYVGANCNVEWSNEVGGERRFLSTFSDIYDISYEMELMSRGRVTMDISTAGLVRPSIERLLLIIANLFSQW